MNTPRIERRTLLWLAGALGLGAAAPAFSEETDWSAFATACKARHPELARSLADQDAYVLGAAADAVKVRAVPEARLFPMGDFAPGVEIGPVGPLGPCMIIRYRFAPHAVLPAHNHPNYSVATVGIAGEVRVTQYDITGEAPPFDSPAGFSVRRMAERRLTRGDAATLSPTRDNIHTFTAGPNGAEIFDVTSLHTHDAGFSYLKIAEARGDADLAAHWWRP